MSRDTSTRGPVDQLIARFPECLKAFDRYCPFTKYGQLEFHTQTMQRRNELGSATRALDDATFQHSLYDTLQAWGIGSRRSNLRAFPDFVAALRDRRAEIAALDGPSIDQADLNIHVVGSRVIRRSRCLRL